MSAFLEDPEARVTVFELVREAEALVVPGLEPVPIAAREGRWKGEPVRIETRGYRGGPFRFARFIELRGTGMEIGNILCLPRFELRMPIFGADLVRIGAQATMVAADLSPEAPPELEDLPPLPSGGTLPEWARRVFSPRALYTRVERVGEAREAFLAYPRALMRVRPAAGDSSGHQRDYCRAHLEDDKGLGLLARMFGDAWARTFLREVMFPV